MEAGSEYSYCDKDTWDECGSHSSLSHQEETPGSRSALEEEVSRLRRALAAERARAGGAARAHDARLAELHGVIAELVRRRAHDKRAAAIPEEDLSISDECESTTQPAGELDNDADRSRTDQNDSSSALSPELLTPQEKREEDSSDTSTREVDRVEPRVEVSCEEDTDHCESSLRLSERDSELCLNTARCCQAARTHLSTGSCERDHGSNEDARIYTSPGRLSRQAKLASRVRLKRTEDSDANIISDEEAWCARAAERLALEVCAQAGRSEARVAAGDESGAVWRARCLALAGEVAVLRAAGARAAEGGRRLRAWAARQESCCVCLCAALRAADAALETYDVLLALAEAPPAGPARAAAETVAGRVLRALERADVAAAEPLLSPGPWLGALGAGGGGPGAGPAGPRWDAAAEARLRAHAARLKADTVALRHAAAQPKLFSYYDAEDDDTAKSLNNESMAEMEAAVMMQEVLSEREAQVVARARGQHHKSESTRSRRRPRDRHWLDTRASETDL